MVNDSHDAWSRSDDTPATLPFWCLLFVTVACGLVATGGLWLPQLDALLVTLEQVR